MNQEVHHETGLKSTLAAQIEPVEIIVVELY